MQVIAPMEARSQPELPLEEAWWFEPKWDGFRCLAMRDGDEVNLQAKSGKPLGRYFPEVVERIAALPARGFVIDGELLVGQPPSFEALQQRLHPAASRIARLARETPARLTLFDMLREDGHSLMAQPLADRRARLSAFVAANPEPTLTLTLTPGTADRAEALGWLNGAYEGVIAKRLDGPYLPGERAMIKVKRQRTADCVVGGFRYASGKPVVGSLLLGLYDKDGKLDHVGFTSGIAAADRAGLTKKLEALRGGPGFTGDAPGGPSRWSTERSAQWEPLQPSLVVEVSYDHVSGGRFRHGTKLVRFRPDKAPSQCRREQIEGDHG
ncbi:MAG: ATP-dependent DNA ligase [Caulobacter sp.]|nr:ATP-dependent DNA ligase [Caulobacter sp.]